VLATVWTIGEYGDVLVAGNSSVFAAEEDDDAEDSGASTASVSEGEVVDLIERILAGAFATELVKEYAVTALIKLSSRFSSSIEPRIRAVVGKYRSNSDVEVQQRAVEYAQLFSLDKATRDAVLEKMPVLEQAKVEEQRKGTGGWSGAFDFIVDVPLKPFLFFRTNLGVGSSWSWPVDCGQECHGGFAGHGRR
jgi:AP-1 complex subunit gamma-1